MNLFATYTKYISSLFKQNVSADQLALIFTICLFLTSFPLIGLTTIIATSIGVKYKMNLPILILVAYMFEPVRFLMFIPFIEIGSTILGVETAEITVASLKNVFSSGFNGIVSFFCYQFLYALIGWFTVTICAILPFHYLFKKLFHLLFSFRRNASAL